MGLLQIVDGEVFCCDDIQVVSHLQGNESVLDASIAAVPPSL
jgi:hypothetical protein